MTGAAIVLVLSAAFIHASWNYLLKKSGGGIGFVWAFAVISSLLYAPLAVGVVIVQHFQFGPRPWPTSSRARCSTPPTTCS